MNTKVLLGFVAGVAVASGVAFLVVHRQTAPAVPVAVTAAAPAPAPVAAPAPTPAAEPAPPAPPPVPEKKHVRASRVRKPAPAPAQSPEPPQAPVQTAAAEPAPPQAAAAPQSTIAPQAAPPPAPASPPSPPRPDPAPAPAAAPAPPAPPPSVTLTSGTLVPVRLGETLDSSRNQTGDTFSATLDAPLVVNGWVIAERGARAEGRIAEVEQAGRVRGLARLALELTAIHTSDGQTLHVRTASFERLGPESKKEDAEKIGIGAILGTVIGAVAGGGKGAAIGAAAGGAAGAGTVAATRGKPAVLPSETRISFRLDQPVTITERVNR
jgi:hypothetical protein